MRLIVTRNRKHLALKGKKNITKLQVPVLGSFNSEFQRISVSGERLTRRVWSRINTIDGKLAVIYAGLVG